MIDHNASDGDLESFPVPLSASETYQLAMGLMQKCNDIFTIMHEQCDEETSRENIDPFIIQTRKELHLINKMWLYELNCEYFRFYQPGGMLLAAGDLRERLHAAGGELDAGAARIYQNLILYHKLCQMGKMTLELNSPADIQNFCMNLRRDISALLLSLAKLYQDASNHKVLDEIIDQVHSGNQVLGQLNWQ